MTRQSDLQPWVGSPRSMHMRSHVPPGAGHGVRDVGPEGCELLRMHRPHHYAKPRPLRTTALTA
jgi:hypothetical protein